jgi:hypothetical protein
VKAVMLNRTQREGDTAKDKIPSARHEKVKSFP